MVAEGLCWTRTAERQTSKMRREYLEAVIHQDVSFFDTNSSTTSTYQVISTISTDTDTVQDVLSEKVLVFLPSHQFMCMSKEEAKKMIEAYVADTKHPS